MDDLREFEEIRSYFETCSKHEGMIEFEKSIYGHAEKLVSHAMKEWRKRYYQEHITLNVEVFNGELCPLLQEQQGLEGEG